jgi:hypothetical protein
MWVLRRVLTPMGTVDGLASSSAPGVAAVVLSATCHAAENTAAKAKKSGSQWTLRWRKTDSNPRSPVGTAFFQTAPEAGDDKPAGNQNRI